MSTGLRQMVARFRHAGNARHCPICQSNVKGFFPFGDPPREDASCPVCMSLERHRLDWVFFQRHTNLFDGQPKKMLHVAPERFLTKRLQKIPRIDYLSSDLDSPLAMVKMDITDIQYPDSTFDAIYCSHVLEHVLEDRKAMSEFLRVLVPGGWALLQVPIMGDRTWEDASITSEEGRKEHFGQCDHVRICGPDYVERMREVGFEADALGSRDVASEEECEKLGFQTDRLLFFCRKPQA